MTRRRSPAHAIDPDGIRLMEDMFGPERAERRSHPEHAADGRMNSLLVEFAYARVWANEILTRRERSLITVALLAATGRENELSLHLEAAVKNGASHDELGEVMVHLALYCGFPAGLTGQRHLQKMHK